VGDINAVSADDPVGLYFRQMAQEPLLTAEEEIELAKRIERGKDSVQKLSRVSRDCNATLRRELDALVEDAASTPASTWAGPTPAWWSPSPSVTWARACPSPI
jgi:hypothetical protein